MPKSSGNVQIREHPVTPLGDDDDGVFIENIVSSFIIPKSKLSQYKADLTEVIERVNLKIDSIEQIKMGILNASVLDM